MELRKSTPAPHPPLRRSPPIAPPRERGKKACELKKRSKWSDNDLQQAIHLLDLGYSMNEVCEAFNMSKSFLRDHYSGKIKDRKMGPKSILTTTEELKLVNCMVEMQNLAYSLTVNELKLKVGEICQERLAPFKDGILSKSWLKWFKRDILS